MKKKKHLTEDESVNLLIQMIDGLGSMHECGMLHRDIKPANILIDNGVYKICDYGLSTVAI
jgi:serine/threonine protein kinase